MRVEYYFAIFYEDNRIKFKSIIWNNFELKNYVLINYDLKLKNILKTKFDINMAIALENFKLILYYRHFKNK